MRALTVGFPVRSLFGSVALFALSVGCSSGDAGKSWNELSTCLAGKAAQSDALSRIKGIRLVQLANTESTGKDAWPARCSQYANDLYAASGDMPVLERKLQDKLGCAADKASCTFKNDESLISTATELWEAADKGGLKAQPAANVTSPATLPDPAFTEATWKTFAPKAGQRLMGPRLTSDGRVLMLLKDGEGVGLPVTCEIPLGFEKMKCTAANAAIPALQLHSVDLASSPSGVFITSLGDKGMSGYNAQTGEATSVRGTGTMVQDGLALEGGGEEGFLAMVMKNGSAGKEFKLPAKVPRNKPIVVGNQAVWIEETEAGMVFTAKAVSGGALKDLANLKGAFNGPFHTCQGTARLGVATWDKNAGQPNAKPTGGDGKTQFTVTQFVGASWTKPVEAILPFDRLAESDLACTASGVSMTFATRKDTTLSVNRLDCTADACKMSTVELPGFESKYWWALAPMGDKVLLLYRANLGETRLRLASLAELPKAKDQLMFDTADFGGPKTPDATPIVAETAALVVFRGEKPVALRIGTDGSAKVLASE